ncbi:L,D-transpeptidase [Aquitalea magnusonii]|uniref:L,D-transpeptidase-like protein n=1 Tax=Aquitalea magnusonii TaxID=332411 RepID=A0A318JVP9_9NEIS|nr:L,D-transpeptidase [Aquitalea magnusonii]PXX49060.1 L,D-transpeptidase-like protein [Aquitalea magnusonii]
MKQSVFTLVPGVVLLLGSMISQAASMPEPDILISQTGQHLVVNLPQARLFLYQDGRLQKIYPVAVGKMLTQTPTGSYAITGVYRDPSWHVPKSIQDEQKNQGKPVLTVVPPGPDNPLGPVFIRFGEAKLGLGFHGTNAPASVPGFRSHGCIRLKNPDALNLADTIQKGAAVTVAYQTVLLNEDSAGELWLTAYKNHYKQDDPSFPHLADSLLEWQRSHAVAVVGKRVDQALKERSGKPVCLTCKSGTANPGELAAVRWLSLPPKGGAPVEQQAVPQDPAAQSYNSAGNKLKPAKKPAVLL